MSLYQSKHIKRKIRVQQTDVTDKWSELKQTLKMGKRRKR